YRHYAPKAPVVLFEGAPDETFSALYGEAGQSWDGVLCFEEYLPAMREKRSRLVYSLGYSWDHAAHAQRLFTLLRHFDHTHAKRILAQCPRSGGVNAGAVNRLRKAAGFSARDCAGGRTVVGITGRTGSGKSVLSSLLKESGALVLDADAIYHELLASDREMLEQIEGRFPGVVRGGVLDRPALSAIVFSDGNALRDLNGITHARVKAVIQERIAASTAPLAALDVPLLFESGLDRLCHVTVAVLARKEVSLARICRRDGITREQALARLNAQPEDDFYDARCDVVLHNRGTLEEFEAQVHAFYEKYCK
ncbi:MAG: dephospho-CoA kinase, partial [Clostridia bacterium]|nr:dephospho-CoA kinase [Clostridia bacterium]